jgi:hypothetical protein
MTLKINSFLIYLKWWWWWGGEGVFVSTSIIKESILVISHLVLGANICVCVGEVRSKGGGRVR